MKNFFRKICPFFKKHKKRILILSIFVVIGVIILPYLGFAQDPPADNTQAADVALDTSGINAKYTEITKFLNVVIQFLQRLLWPVLLMIGGLLKNDILFSAGMEETMLKIWENVRNLVNVLFVLILLGIAFYNVIGGEAQDYQPSAILPKFVIALIAVNFSFLAIKVVLDGVNVLTTAIFALPGAVNEKSLSEDEYSKIEKGFCEGLMGKKPQATEEKPAASGESGEATEGTDDTATEDKKSFCTADKKFTDDAKQFFNQYASHNAAIILAINMAKITKLDEVKVSTGGLKDLAINMLFSATLFIVYAISFVALFIILLVRLVVLWMVMVLSPLIALVYVLPESLKSSMGGGDLTTQFVKNAIVPLPVALVMSIGFIMLQALQQAHFTQLSLNESTLGINLLTSGLSTLQDVIVAVGMVAFIWVGVFKAAEGTAAQSIVEKIKGASEGFGKFVATAPFKYAPIIPIKVGKGQAPQKVSMAGAMEALRRYPDKFRQEAQSDADKITGGIGKESLDLGKKQLKDAKTYREVETAMVTAAGSSAAYKDPELRKLFAQKLGTMSNDLKIQNAESVLGMSWNDFVKKVKKGDIDEETMRKYIDALKSRGVRANQPPAEEKNNKPGETKNPKTATGGTSDLAVGAGVAAYINDGHESNVNKIFSDADREKIEKAKKSGDAADKKAAESLSQVIAEDRDEAQKMGTAIGSALKITDASKRKKDVQEAIQKRAKNLKGRISNQQRSLPPEKVRELAKEILEEELNAMKQGNFDPSTVDLDAMVADEAAAAPAGGAGPATPNP